MKPWDRHCPECGGDEVRLDFVKVDRLRKRCTGCGHRWSEERPMPMGAYAIEADPKRHMQASR